MLVLLPIAHVFLSGMSHLILTGLYKKPAERALWKILQVTTNLEQLAGLVAVEPVKTGYES